ncbi:hypothetical protein OIU78_014478 [Salix suchowensis]|nr:hypothetical protein OIU78_014478 [Salix suchowensis]
MATKNLIRAGASLMNRLMISKNPIFHHKRNLHSSNANSSPFPFFCLQLPANRLPLNY